MERNLHLEDPGMRNKSNYTLQTSFIKNDINQKVHYLHNRAIYPLPEYLTRAFERLDELINRLMNATYKK